jgi:glutaredoxin
MGFSMRAIVWVAVLGAGYVYFNGVPGSSSSGAFDASGVPLVHVFTFSGCGEPCDTALTHLNKRDVDFEHYIVDPENKQTEVYTLWSKYKTNNFPLIAAGNDTLTNSSNASLAMILGKNFDTQYLTSREKNYYSEHFHADGSPKIVMYGTDWCPGCAKLRKDFEEAGVEYVEVDVEKPRLKKTLLRDLEIGGYPATWVGYTRINSSAASVIANAVEDY